MAQNVCRPKIWKAVKKVWSDTIRENYNRSHELNSEHSLQAALYARLKPEIADISPNLTIFVEPKIRLGREAKAVVFPDILICNIRSLTLICAIELKYKPRVTGAAIKKALAKDIKTLLALANVNSSICFEHERHHGPRPRENLYKSTPTTLYVWAGVYAAKSKDTQASEDAKFVMNVIEDGGLRELAESGKFRSLHAITSKDEPAQVWPTCP
ncbi:hypothetical protein [Sulfuritalea sp.]|uniref:hypothetical protein n=1 Tax=Sulfuritalea sp. TaxID=2480090 RepID=UPI001ACD0FA3|nr:hypothetical protein [Sulfuritalea sp.]MBN8475709.1 hypothetical protein [Sulfuritalea sp.]